MGRTSKRSESPVGVSGPLRRRDPIPQEHGARFGKHVSPKLNRSHSKSLVMPLFLKLTDQEIYARFVELAICENERLSSLDDDRWAYLEADPILDRYSNIYPWEHNRIHLQVPEGTNDYINASEVSVDSVSPKRTKFKSGIQNKYICMQGPKMETIDHTWHMLWHELSTPSTTSPAVIIMLSSLRDPHPNRPGQTVEKCYQYFPMDETSPPLSINESGHLGESFKASVKFVSREPTPQNTSIEIRKLAMSVEGNEEKIIWHLLYPAWPDYSALDEEHVGSIISLMALSREKNSESDNPRIVHCSAGVGRTGTFVALEHLIGELESGRWEDWDTEEHNDYDAIFETVNQLREQRRSMVQSYEQFAFLYEVIRRMWEEKYGNPDVPR